MIDPHVESLYYGVSSGPGTAFVTGASLVTTTMHGLFAIDNDVLKVTLAEHFSSVGAARDAIDPFLRSWEVQANLSTAPDVLHFEYCDASIVDRAPPGTRSAQSVPAPAT